MSAAIWSGRGLELLEFPQLTGGMNSGKLSASFAMRPSAGRLDGERVKTAAYIMILYAMAYLCMEELSKTTLEGDDEGGRLNSATCGFHI